MVYMNTLLFKYAIEIEHTRSISRAARNLMMAQPNLSKSIKELEDSLGFAIFERTSKGVIPTARGEVFLDYARGILSQLDCIEQLAMAGDGNVQKFSIAVSRGSYISSSIVQFAEGLDSGSGIDLDIRETSSMDVINNVSRGRYNLGIIRCRSIYEQYFSDFLAQHRIASEAIWDFQYLALMSRRHPLANETVIVPKDLQPYIEIVHGDTMIPYLPAEAGANQHQPAPVSKKIRLYERCNQFEMLSHITGSFMWGSPIPEDMLQRYGLIQRKCDFADNSYKDLLIYPQGYHLSAIEKRYVDVLRDVIKKMSQRHYR